MKKRSLALVVSLVMSACTSSRTAPASDLPGEFAVTKPRRKGLSGNVAPLSWQGRVFLPRAGSPNNRNHELDDFHNSFFSTGRTKAGPDPAQPGSGGQGASVDR